MADITPKNEVPSDHTTPPEAGSNVAPPADAERLPADSHEATAELTRAVNAREDEMEAAVDDKHASAARQAGAKPEPKAAAKDDKARAKKDDDKEDADARTMVCNQCNTKNPTDASACKKCGINF